MLSDPTQPLIEKASIVCMRKYSRYVSDSDCKYVRNGKEIDYPLGTVDRNNYNLSGLRENLQEIESERFNEKEQTMMKTTKIYTYDTRNGVAYYNEDKLYTPYAPGFETNTITVGENTESNLDKGINILVSGLPYSKRFWLRTARRYYDPNMLVALPGKIVSSCDIYNCDPNIVSALKIDIKSVLFASLTKPVLSSKDFSRDFDEENVLIFRYDGSDKIKSEAILLPDVIFQNPLMMPKMFIFTFKVKIVV